MIREDVAAIARSYAGCGVTAEKARYADLVMGPGDKASQERYFTAPTTSGCALVVRGIWRKAGYSHRLLDDCYKVGHAIADLVAIGREAHAWVPSYARAGRLPQPGDAVIVGGPGQEHAYTVLEVDKPDGVLAEFVTVDGGQRDSRGNQCIGFRRRIWNMDHDGTVIDRVTGPEPGPWIGRKRPLLGWVDVGQL